MTEPPRTAPARPLTFEIPLRTLAPGAPFRWLQRGWRDFIACPRIGIFYGACFAAMGWGLLTVFEHAPAYTLGLSAGFLLMGPVLCLGIYRVSQQLERGEKPAFLDSLLCWRSRLSSIGLFGLVLLVLELLWGRASLVVFALSFDGMPDFKGSLLALLDPQNLPFIVTYLGVGGIFAGLIFSISVVAIPMMLDRATDPITAGITSLRLVMTQLPVMLLWGALITALIVVALLPAFAGLLLIGPLLGHASWHAYRDAVGGDTTEPPGAD
jgi:uncharacterized membrane protein